MIHWSYGVMSVPSRAETLLPRTLESLKLGGFEHPAVFVDFEHYGVYGSWMLAAWKLYLQNPFADAYIIFQDDIVVYKNLRQYLEQLKYPLMGYFNLSTWPENAELATKTGWFESNQKGRSACGLLFTSEGFRLLLHRKAVVDKARDRRKPGKCVDGMIIEAMRELDWKEYCHFPSLLKHTGDNQSTTNNQNSPVADSFKGEDFDALDFLGELDAKDTVHS